MYNQPPAVAPRRGLNWAAIDLDGTLAQGIWTPDDPTSEIGPPISNHISLLLKLVEIGWKIHIHTSRPWADHERIKTWLEYWQIPFDQIHCGKLLAGMYVDDRAVNAGDKVWSLTGEWIGVDD